MTRFGIAVDENGTFLGFNLLRLLGLTYFIYYIGICFMGARKLG
jgi:hypothetical protein